MSEPKVLFEDHGNIAVIKLNRPEKRYALDPETVMMFNEFSEKAKDPKFRAVIPIFNFVALETEACGIVAGWQTRLSIPPRLSAILK